MIIFIAFVLRVRWNADIVFWWTFFLNELHLDPIVDTACHYSIVYIYMKIRLAWEYWQTQGETVPSVSDKLQLPFIFSSSIFFLSCDSGTLSLTASLYSFSCFLISCDFFYLFLSFSRNLSLSIFFLSIYSICFWAFVFAIVNKLWWKLMIGHK